MRLEFVVVYLMQKLDVFLVVKKVKVKWSRYKPGVSQRVGRGIALLFHDRGTRRGWGVSSTPRPHFTPGKDPVPILQEAGWIPGPVWTGGKSRPHWYSSPDRPGFLGCLYENYWGDPGVDGRIILRLIFRKWDVGVWTGSGWLRIGTVVGHLWMR